ncbi:MAG: PQQ-binding-like beta-propeller repeat protein [Verrucomicrobiota bacterium]
MKLLTPLLLALGTLSCLAGNWPNWRGPNHDGSSTETGLPAKFSPTENCLWSIPLPGPAASTPVVWEDSVFLTTTDEPNQKLLGLCLDRKTGKERWRKEVGTGFRSDDRSNFGGPSPVTDGERVIFFFGTGDMAAYDFSGRELWKRQIQKDYGSFAFLWTFSSSPVLDSGRLYLQVLQRDTSFEGNGALRGRREGNNESYLLALNPADGKELWRHVRPSDAKGESHEAFSTPVPMVHNGRRELVVAGGDCLTGHDPANGRELWRWGTWNPEKISHWRLVPGPVAGQGTVLVCAPKRAPVYAIKAGGSGTLKDDSIAWSSSDEVNSKDVSSDVSTPLFYQNRFYVMNSDRKALTCLDPKTGKMFWEQRVDGIKIESSPTGADGKIYFMDQRGKVTVMAAGDEAKMLLQVDMGDPSQKDIRSSIAAAQGCLFIRTNNTLFCIGHKS